MNEFHRGEQDAIKGILILNLVIPIIRKPEIFPSFVKIVERATNGQQG
jgi:hypothetical protein